jgi:pyrimidine operon attenuation protein / uracil phosphoribosyltransferase
LSLCHHEGLRSPQRAKGLNARCANPTVLELLASASARAYDATVMTTQNAALKTGLRQKAQLMSASDMDLSMVRLAYQIVEENGTNGLGLIGIRRRGVPLAERLSKSIGHIENVQVPVGTLDITFYRDDLSTVGPKPVVNQSEIGFAIQDKNIVLVDDVLFTGRTIRAALDALFSQGRPRRVQLCVLIDRGHRELPIEAAFVGRTVQTTMNEVIEVKLKEIDGMEKVLLMEK